MIEFHMLPRNRLRPVILLTCIFILAACQAAPTPAATEYAKPILTNTGSYPTPAITPAPTSTTKPPHVQADLVFINGAIVTMNPDAPQAEALAVAGNLILDVGTNQQILAYQGPNTTVIDLQGRTLLPGFIDAHTHLFNDHDALGTDLLGAQELALSNGITTLGNMYASQEFVDEMQALDDAGDLIVRTSLYLSVTTNCGDLTGDWWQEIPVTRVPGERLRMGGIKIFADGGSCKKLAGSQEILPGYGTGDLFFTQDDMNAFLQEAQDLGYQLAIHAQGDRAIDQVFNAFAEVLNGKENVLRHRIEHNALVRSDQLKRYSELDVVATLFGYQEICDMPAWTDFYKEVDENPHALLDANPGGHFAWHGDDPYLPPISPLLDLASMVTRHDISDSGEMCEPPDWQREKTIIVQEGLQLMTMGSAYALFREKEVGSLEAGKYADMVILNDDPTSIPDADLWKLALLATFVDGKAVYCSADYSSPCEMEGTGGQVPDAVSDEIQVRASKSLPGSSPQAIFDDSSGGMGWISGDMAPQWIEIDLGSEKVVTGLRLWVNQDPAGFTIHRILGGLTPAPTTELTRFEGITSSGQLLEVAGVWHVRYLRIETVESPSWVAWQKVEVDTE